MRKLRMEDSTSFFNYTRMEPHMFDEILHRVGPRIQKSPTQALIWSSVLTGWHLERFESFRARANNEDSGGSLARCDCACATLLALPPRYCCVHEFLATLLQRFRCASSPRRFCYVNFEQAQNKRREVAIMKLRIRFHYDQDVSTAPLPFLLRFMAFWPNFRSAAESPSSGMGV